MTMGKPARVRMLKPRVAEHRAALYGTKPTKRLRGLSNQNRRERLLRANPLCVHCEREGIIRAAQEIDHITPMWEGGQDVDANLQGLCVEHHRLKSAAEAARRGK